LAIYARADGTGYIVSSDQVPGASRVMVYPREGVGGAHDQPLLAAIPTAADGTDGLEVTSQRLPGLPAGMLVMMNSGARNFLIYDWNALRSRMAH
jgi:myo-inositol-hexaphosphate 3-phosphohydrolase